MLQDSDSSASSDGNCDLIENAIVETDAREEEAIDISSSGLTGDGDNSFVGKVRTNVTNIISKLFTRSPRTGPNTPKHNQQFRFTNRDDSSYVQVPKITEQRKRKHSPTLSPPFSDDRYTEMIRKRSRLNVPTNEPAATQKVNRYVSRSSTPNSVQERSSMSIYSRRLALRKAAGIVPRAGIRQKANVSRPSSASVSSEAAPYTPGTTSWHREASNGHEPESEGLQRTSTTGTLDLDRDSVASEPQRPHQEDGDTDSLSARYGSLGGLRKSQSALNAGNDDSRRFSGFLGNAIANQRNRIGGSTSNLSFSSHLDNGKSLFGSGSIYERPAFNSSVYGSMSSLSSFVSNPTASPFYNGVTRYGGASAVVSEGRKNADLPGPFTPKQLAKIAAKNSMTSTRSQVFASIMATYSAPLNESRRRAAYSMARDKQRTEEILAQPYLNRSKIGSGPVHLQRPCMTESLQSRIDRNLLGSELLVPRTLQMLGIARMQQTTENARKCTISHPVEYTLPGEQQQQQQSASDKQTTKMRSKINCRRGELSAKERDMYSPAVPLALPNVKLPEMASYPKFDLNLPYTSAQHAAAPADRHQSTVLSSPVQTITASRQPENADDTDTCRSIGKGRSFVFGAPKVLESASEGSRAVSVKRFDLSLPDTLNVLSSFQPLTGSASTGNEWKCDTCWISNKASATKCAACETPKPTPKMTAPVESVPKMAAPFQPLLMSTTSGSEWKCDTCWVSNKQSATKCAACETPKPAPKTTAPATFQPLLMSATSGSEWKCDTCWVSNKQSATKCAACETPKPAPKTTAPTASVPKPAATFQPLLVSAASGNEWKCDTCWVSNKQSATNCAACETPKPAPKTTASVASAAKQSAPTAPISLPTINPLSAASNNHIQPAPSSGGQDRSVESTVQRNGAVTAGTLFGGVAQATARSNGPQRANARAVGPKATESAAESSEVVIAISDDSDDDVCEVISDSDASVVAEPSPTPNGYSQGGQPADTTPFNAAPAGPGMQASDVAPAAFGSGFTFGVARQPQVVPSVAPQPAGADGPFPNFQFQNSAGIAPRAKRPLDHAGGGSNGNHSGVSKAAEEIPYSFAGATVPNFNFSATGPTGSGNAKRTRDLPAEPVFLFGGLTQPNPSVVSGPASVTSVKNETLPRRLKLRATRRFQR